MGFDVKIISMNLTKVGCQNQSYLRQLLDGERPDLCLLPGDNNDIKNCVVCDYKQWLTQGNDQTVLLYNPNRLTLKRSPVGVNEYPQLPGINFDSLVCPEMEMDTGPYKEPKRISILTWHYSMTREININKKTQVESIIRLSQAISMTRKIPIFIGGDFNLDLCTVEKIVKHMSTEGQHEYIQQATGMFPETYLPSMVNGTLRPQRHLIAMNVFACRQEASIVTEYGSPEMCTDYFVASKSLVLKETTLVDFGSATGKKTQVDKCVTEEPKPKPVVYDYAPTRTIMSAEPRPPKHSGG